MRITAVKFPCLLLVALAAPAIGALPPAPAGVSTFTELGIEFSRVQASNVAPFQASGGLGNVNRAVGGGSWDFGLARTELTQGRWIEMPNALNAVPVPQGQPWTTAVEATLRGAGWPGPGMFSRGVGPQGRLIWEVTEPGNVQPVTGMGFVASAMFCNWLHNDREATINALLQGAYDLRQWNDLEPITWLTAVRSSDARFWIPTYDEWAVGSFYDPNRLGPGDAGWWNYTNRLDRLPFPGPPGIGETSAGWNTEPSPVDSYLIAVGSYPNSQSPWGLLDTSGSRYEQLEDEVEFDRTTAGTRNGMSIFPEDEARLEQIGWIAQDGLSRGGAVGLRIATRSIPSLPSFGVFMISSLCVILERSRR